MRTKKILISLPDTIVSKLDEGCRLGGFSRSEYIRSLIRGSVPEIKDPPVPLEEFSKQFTEKDKKKAREANKKDGLCKHGKFGYCVEGCFK